MQQLLVPSNVIKAENVRTVDSWIDSDNSWICITSCENDFIMWNFWLYLPRGGHKSIWTFWIRGWWWIEIRGRCCESKPRCLNPYKLCLSSFLLEMKFYYHTQDFSWGFEWFDNFILKFMLTKIFHQVSDRSVVLTNTDLPVTICYISASN